MVSPAHWPNIPATYAMGGLRPGTYFILGDTVGETLGNKASSWSALTYISLIADPLEPWCIMEATTKLPILVSSISVLTILAISPTSTNLVLNKLAAPACCGGSALVMTGTAFAAWRARTAA